MSLKEFLELTPKEFFEALWEREEHEEHKIIAQVRMICETIRLQTAHLLNIQLPRGKKIQRLSSLMQFDWDKKKAKPAQTKEEMKAIMKVIAGTFKGTKKKNEDGKKRRSRIGRKS